MDSFDKFCYLKIFEPSSHNIYIGSIVYSMSIFYSPWSIIVWSFKSTNIFFKKYTKEIQVKLFIKHINMNIDIAAVNILKRGVELDTKKRYTEALVCYQEGLQILVDKIKDEQDENVRSYLRKKVEEYMNRAEDIKKLVIKQKEEGKFHEQVHIEDNSSGHSYYSLFGRFLDEDVQFVLIEDPYIRAFHQCQNFLRLCELLVKSCKNLRYIELITSVDTKNEVDQKKWLSCIRNDLEKFNIKLDIKFSNTLHDRQITISSGWVIKIGRGLDFYKPLESKFCLGANDMDLRPCHETTVDIIHSKNIKQSYG